MNVGHLAIERRYWRSFRVGSKTSRRVSASRSARRSFVSARKGSDFWY